MSTDLRIPFEEAITEPSLLKKRFDGLSLPQQVLLKAFYGLPLSRSKIDPITGFSELEYWAAFQGFAQYDALGYLESVTGVPDYLPQEYREGWGIIGRRGSKTDAFAATVVAYEAVLGGHESYLRQSQVGLCFLIAQDLRMARYSLKFVLGALESSPLLAKGIKQVTADRIDLKNNMTVACVPPTLKSVRGYANALGVLDEVGVWYQDAESANPDQEIYRALSPGQIQFPNPKLIGISTPWNKNGLLWKNYEAGTGGTKLPPAADRAEFNNVLVMHGTTALMANPFVTPDYLRRERDKDLYAFQRECLAMFQDSISGFLPAALVEAAVDQNVYSRDPRATYTYVAVIDPAFRRDAFALTIMHRDEFGRVVQDIALRFVPPVGGTLNPRTCLIEVAKVCQRFSLSVLYSDQYQLESLRELALEYGLMIMGVPFSAKSKAEMYGNLQQLFAQGQIRLLDHAETIKELKSLERTLTASSGIQIQSPAGGFDDMCSTVCIAAAQARLFLPSTQTVDGEERLTADLPYTRIMAQLEAKSRALTFWD